jgi:hypothetical protein
VFPLSDDPAIEHSRALLATARVDITKVFSTYENRKREMKDVLDVTVQNVEAFTSSDITMSRGGKGVSNTLVCALVAPLDLSVRCALELSQPSLASRSQRNILSAEVSIEVGAVDVQLRVEDISMMYSMATRFLLSRDWNTDKAQSGSIYDTRYFARRRR